MMQKAPRAVILAGGKGVRLRPFTASLPKPLVPIGDMPILELVLKQLINNGFGRATLTLGHLSALIRAYVTQQAEICSQLDVDFVQENEPTGTAGSLATIPDLDEPFLVMNGDVLTNIDYQALLAYHKESGAAITIATHQQEVNIDLGVLKTDPSGSVVDYLEKPKKSYEVSMGVYAYSPRTLSHIKPGQYLDFPDLVLKLIRAGEKVQTYRSNAFWLDIGRPDDYAKAQDIFESEPEMFGLMAA